MRGRLVLLLGGAVAVLVSLYLPWEQASGDSHVSIDGWRSGGGAVTALVALTLSATALAGLVLPDLLSRLPLARCAVVLGYLTLAVGLLARSTADLYERRASDLEFHLGPGLVVGLAGAVVVLAAALSLRRRELMTAPAAGFLPLTVLGGALAFVCLLPWWRYSSYDDPGIAIPPAQLAAALGVMTAGWSWASESARRLSPFLAAGAAIFAVAAMSTISFPAERAYGAWLGLGCAVALVVLALAHSGLAWLRATAGSSLVFAIPAALLVIALFLPWQGVCYERSSDFDELSGRCVSTNGWTTSGSAAALLALTLVACTLASTRISLSALELAAGIAILVATLGFALEDRSSNGVTLEPGYGSWVGFAAAAALVVVAVLRVARTAIDRTRVLRRLIPLAFCAAYLVLVVLPWWDLLPQGWRTSLFLAEPSWLTIAGVLLGMALVGAWLRQLPGRSQNVLWLPLLPVGMLALLLVDLARLDTLGLGWLETLRLGWGDGVIAVLCLALAYLGRVEEQGGLEHARVPEILRVDRL